MDQGNSALESCEDSKSGTSGRGWETCRGKYRFFEPCFWERWFLPQYNQDHIFLGTTDYWIVQSHLESGGVFFWSETLGLTGATLVQSGYYRGVLDGLGRRLMCSQGWASSKNASWKFHETRWNNFPSWNKLKQHHENFMIQILEEHPEVPGSFFLSLSQRPQKKTLQVPNGRSTSPASLAGETQQEPGDLNNWNLAKDWCFFVWTWTCSFCFWFFFHLFLMMWYFLVNVLFYFIFMCFSFF